MTREEAICGLEDMLMSKLDGRNNLEVVGKEVPIMLVQDIEALKMAIEALQERPKGRWIENRTATYNAYTDDFEEVPHYNCSLCDCPMDWKAPFCPECGHPMEVDGADMRESE